VSKKQAKAALTKAAYRQYWRTEAPKLRVPLRLVKAVAWHESGWQSDIVNCDGGKGLMQVMPDTVDHMNQRFGLAYRVDDYRDNAFLGANYLAYLTKEFGNDYFKGSHDLSAGKCRSHSDRCLLNLVIAAYNFGEGSVREVVRSKSDLPNPAYVDSVRSLMRKCFCDRY
jgi:soluble lytic murein transglycosylase-like protein